MAELKISNNMKLITKKNISFSLAVVMAGLIITSATAAPRTKEHISLSSPELDEYVADYFASIEDVDFETPEKVKLYNGQDELVYDGLAQDMNADQQKLLRQAKVLTTMGSSKYYKIF